MTHRQRMETAWSFKEGDRVPIELDISAEARKHPKAQRVLELIDQHADNFQHAGWLSGGFFGFPGQGSDETIEDVPGSHKLVRHVQKNAAGEFTAVTRHPVGEIDYRWEKRYITTIDDLRRVAETPRPPIHWDKDAWNQAVAKIGERGIPVCGLEHPLGRLVRSATTDEVYAWFYEYRDVIHQYLAAANAQLTAGIAGIPGGCSGIVFMTWAHEMFIPPWAGHAFFDEFVFPYDKVVNDTIHKLGGRLRIHCHGNCGGFLEKFADMGVDAMEPMEHSPRGDVDLADAKRRVGHRMLLSGNVASECFGTCSAEDVRTQVREAIRAAAPGGGFSLSMSGADGGTSMQPNDELMGRALDNAVVFLEAGLEYGQYPIR